MIKGYRYQRGIGMGGIFFVIVLAAFFVTLIVRLGPAYMQFGTIESIMNSVAESPEPIDGGSKGIMSTISRRMEVNDVRDIDMKSFKLTRAGDGKYDVNLSYERRIHLFFNVDAVLSFDKLVTVKAQ